jgi:hypothetical protein
LGIDKVIETTLKDKHYYFFTGNNNNNKKKKTKKRKKKKEENEKKVQIVLSFLVVDSIDDIVERLCG